jgi:transcription antitermination protein NusB
MASRRRGREIALQILCLLDRQPDLDAERGVELYFGQLFGSDLDGEEEPADKSAAAKARPAPLAKETLELRRFVEDLVFGVRDHLDELDSLLGRCSRNWRLERMSWVDRNLLRLAAFELTRSLDTPARVILNEAIELARRYSTAESPGFVNGVLDRALRETNRSDPPAAAPPAVSEHAAP